MRFLVDVGLALAVATWLREQGHDAIHLREQCLQRLDDPAIFAKAAAEQRVLVTCDLDFAEIVALSGTAAVSAILFRMASLRPVRVMERLARVLAESSVALESGVIIVVEESRHRVRKLPLGN